MSIIVKGMKMPKTCGECRFSVDGWCYAIASNDDQPGYIKSYEKAKWCPLIEVPPHGDLIDRDVLRASFKESIDECHKWANEIPNETEMYARVSQSLGTFVECSLRTKGMPTVIPADKDGEI